MLTTIPFLHLKVHISPEDKPQLRASHPRNARQCPRRCGRQIVQELQPLRRAEISTHRGLGQNNLSCTVMVVIVFVFVEAVLFLVVVVVVVVVLVVVVVTVVVVTVVV